MPNITKQKHTYIGLEISDKNISDPNIQKYLQSKGVIGYEDKGKVVLEAHKEEHLKNLNDYQDWQKKNGKMEVNDDSLKAQYEDALQSAKSDDPQIRIIGKQQLQDLARNGYAPASIAYGDIILEECQFDDFCGHRQFPKGQEDFWIDVKEAVGYYFSASKGNLSTADDKKISSERVKGVVDLIAPLLIDTKLGALNFLLNSANSPTLRNEPHLYFALGFCYQHGIGIEKDEGVAQYYLDIAKKGNVTEDSIYAHYYLATPNVPVLEAPQQPRAKLSSFAKVNKALHVKDPLEREKERQKQIENRFNDAVKKNNIAELRSMADYEHYPPACFLIGDCFNNGSNNFAVNKALAARYYSLAALEGEFNTSENGKKSQQKIQGVVENLADNLKKDKTAFNSLKQIADETKNPNAQYAVGFCYKNAIGTSLDSRP